MKSLNQVEPRTAITNLPFTISQGGSYYLTQSYAQDFGANALVIATNNVTVDLCGFTIQNTGNQTVNGIELLNPAVNVPIKNAVVKNGTISGFNPSDGIEGQGTRNCVFEDLVISACGEALVLEARGTAGVVGNIIRRCRICDNAAAGIILTAGASNTQNLIQDCELLNDNTSGLNVASQGNLIANCRASGNTANYVIHMGNREGLIVQPATNTLSFSGSSGGQDTGTGGDHCANLSY